MLLLVHLLNAQILVKCHLTKICDSGRNQLQLLIFSDTDTSLATLSDVVRSVKNLKDEAERLETVLSKTDRDLDQEKGKLKSFIDKIQKELHMGESAYFNTMGYSYLT